MKRIANNVALQTLFYTICAYQKIRIFDRKYIGEEKPQLIYEGNYDEFSREWLKPSNELYTKYKREHRLSDYMIEHAEIHEIKANGDYLEITLQTNSDIY